MNRALFVLLKLRFKGWCRRTWRNIKTPKGAILTAIFAFFMFIWCGGISVNALFNPGIRQGKLPLEQVERFGPYILLVYCVSMIATSGAASPFVFAPAEVQFLFSGPFSRRQLLAYKLLVQMLMTLPFSIFMAFAMRSFSGSFLSGLAGAALVFVFFQMFGIAVNLVSCYLGEWLYGRLRRVFFLGLIILSAAAVGWAMLGSGYNGDAVDFLKRVDESPIVRYAIAPLSWFVKVFTATEWDLNFLRYIVQASAFNLILLGLVFGLDARYMESAAANSERRYAMLQKMRSGGLTSLSAARGGKARGHLKAFPRWGGIGPIAWRQMIAAIRSRRVLGILVFATLMGSIGPLISMISGAKMPGQTMPFMLAGIALMMSLLLNQALSFDFRSDVDRIEVLKTLPIPAWCICIGQLITPVMYASLYQVLLIAVLHIVLGHLGILLAYVATLSWPVNLLLTGVENWLFLMFPSRMGAATPGDFSHAGRQMMLMLGKGMALLIGLGFPAVFSVLAYYSSGGSWFAAVPAAFVPAVIISVLPIPLVAMAFKNFDVSRDVPP